MRASLPTGNRALALVTYWLATDLLKLFLFLLLCLLGLLPFMLLLAAAGAADWLALAGWWLARTGG